MSLKQENLLKFEIFLITGNKFKREREKLLSASEHRTKSVRSSNVSIYCKYYLQGIV